MSDVLLISLLYVPCLFPQVLVCL